MVGLWASVAECAGAVSQARGYIGAATLGAAGALIFTRGARHWHAHGHGHGHGHSGPRETARLLEAEGRGVPAFLAPPHASGHVPVHSAVATLASTLRRVNPTSDTLGLVSTDYLGRVHPAFPPHDERHRPPHAIALAMHEELGAASPFHGLDQVKPAVEMHHRGGKHGHGHARPHELAAQLEAEGRGVPAFLAPPHASGHVPVHSAVATLASTLRRVNPTSDTLGLVSTDYLGRVHPAFPPHDERHRPPHAIALAMHEELGAASPWHAPDARAPLTTEAATAKGSERRLDDVVRRLEARVAALEAENRTLRAAGRQER